VNYVKLGEAGIKLGFMSSRNSNDAIRAQAEKIKARLAARGCTVCGAIVEPNPNESFFWFRIEERPESPSVRELLESYDDVILR
jgi:hypothetical protein